MGSLLRRYGIPIIAALAMAASTAAWSQAPQAAGRFVSVTGDVSVVGSDGVRRAAERGGDIREGDTIVTGDASLAQARMADGGLISVRAESEFKLEQFGYKGKDDRSASFVVNILKGGFRTITGLIAQVNRSGYKISTPAATIGVRGTHFEVVHVLPQVASQQVPAGTYNRVFEGITTVQNPGGNILQVVREQTAFAALQGGNPVLIAPPAAIFGRPTPVPRAAIPQDKDRAHKDAIKGEDRGFKMGDRGLKMDDRAFKADRGLKRGDAPVAGERPALREAIPLTPIDSTTTLRSVPISPIETTTIQVAPTTTTIRLDSTTTTLSPTTTTTISPTTTTISPTLSTTTTISPTLSTTTTLSPTTTTISPTLSTTTTISPTLSTTISPTTTTTSPTTSTILQSPTTTTPIIKR